MYTAQGSQGKRGNEQLRQGNGGTEAEQPGHWPKVTLPISTRTENQKKVKPLTSQSHLTSLDFHSISHCSLNLPKWREFQARSYCPHSKSQLHRLWGSTRDSWKDRRNGQHRLVSYSKTRQRVMGWQDLRTPNISIRNSELKSLECS